MRFFKYIKMRPGNLLDFYAIIQKFFPCLFWRDTLIKLSVQLPSLKWVRPQFYDSLKKQIDIIPVF